MYKLYETDRDLFENIGELHERFKYATREFPTSDRDNIREIGLSNIVYYEFLRDPFKRRYRAESLRKIEEFVILREKQIDALAKIKKSGKI